MNKNHIATYALPGITGRRVGTGYIYSPEEITSIREQFLKIGYPFNLRWRNDECRLRASLFSSQHATLEEK